MQAEIARLEESGEAIDLRAVGNIGAKAVQTAAKDDQGREGGTLYSSFINITDMEFVLVYKYDNNRRIHLDLKGEFSRKRKKKIQLEKL
jgi:choloylglycine hydrolase